MKIPKSCYVLSIWATEPNVENRPSNYWWEQIKLHYHIPNWSIQARTHDRRYISFPWSGSEWGPGSPLTDQGPAQPQSGRETRVNHHIATTNCKEQAHQHTRGGYLVINDLYDMPRAPLLGVGQWPALDSHLQVECIIMIRIVHTISSASN